MDSFVVFDIELANSNPSSICEIAFIKFIDGKASDALVSLLKPNPNDISISFNNDDADNFKIIVDPISQSIHGIRSEDLGSAPKLSDIWSEVLDYIGELPLVAHNATQDINKLFQALKDYDLVLPDREYFCSLTLSRNAPETRGFESHRLEDVALSMDVDWFLATRPSGLVGHAALVDANATGEIMVKLLETKSGSFKELCSSLEMLPGRIVGGKVKNGNTKIQQKNPLWLAPSLDDFATIVASLAELGFAPREDHPFFGKNFVLSLSLESLDETSFWICIALAGGQMKTSVSKFTHFLVEGNDPKGKYKKGETSKSLKAREILANGKGSLRILDESEFMSLLGKDVLLDLENYKSKN
jgi:DNA polymerase-3 subunit epsilon